MLFVRPGFFLTHAIMEIHGSEKNNNNQFYPSLWAQRVHKHEQNNQINTLFKGMEHIFNLAFRIFFFFFLWILANRNATNIMKNNCFNEWTHIFLFLISGILLQIWKCFLISSGVLFDWSELHIWQIYWVYDVDCECLFLFWDRLSVISVKMLLYCVHFQLYACKYVRVCMCV